jgi:DNA-binding transcriptional ArsR family regulator
MPPHLVQRALVLHIVAATPVPMRSNLDRRCIVHLLVNDSFKAIAHPIRRGIVERLSQGPATVAEATGGFGVSKPAITKHLKVLEESGLVTRVIDGRKHRLALDPAALSEAGDWIERQRAQWERLFEVVDDYLEERKGKR